MSEPPHSLELEQALQHMENGRIAAAAKALETVLESDPKLAAAHALLAECHVMAGKLEESVAELTLAGRLAPDDPGILCQIGWTHANSGRLSAAREDLERSLSLAPDLTESHVGLAFVASRTGDAKAFRRHITEALALEPEHEMARQLLAEYKREHGDFGGAGDEFAALLARDPDDPDYLVAMAAHEFARRNYAAALDLASQAMRRQPNDRQALWLCLAASMAQRSLLRRILSRPILWLLRLGTAGMNAYFLGWMGLCLIGVPLAIGLGYGGLAVVMLNVFVVWLILGGFFLFGWVDRKARKEARAIRLTDGD
ncbi:MAG: tetratricopeptide repeat protein [Rhodospirillales bacterium]|nr:MAG: tetratricopeptide repeat protein [Rhodospirillales bacterium]